MSELHDHLSSEQLLYGCVWEDEALLTETLDIGPDDDVLSICSAGCNVLAMLARGPRSITAVDLNPLELALLELKLAGIRRLEHTELAELIGESPSDKRLSLYQRVRPDLSDPARKLWDAREAVIARGIVESGRLEMYLSQFAKQRLPQLWDPDLAHDLVDCQDPAIRTRLLEARGNLPALHIAVREHFGAAAMAQGRSEAQLKHVGIADVGEENYQRFHRFVTGRRWRGNHYLERLLCGKLRDPHKGPAYLRPDLFNLLKSRIDRVSLARDNIGSVLEKAAHGAFSKANLSDLFEYLSAEDADTLFSLLANRLRQGGRFAYWDLLVPRSPKAAKDRLTTLAEGQSDKDRVFFYGAFNAHAIR